MVHKDLGKLKCFVSWLTSFSMWLLPIAYKSTYCILQTETIISVSSIAKVHHIQYFQYFSIHYCPIMSNKPKSSIRPKLLTIVLATVVLLIIGYVLIMIDHHRQEQDIDVATNPSELKQENIIIGTSKELSSKSQHEIKDLSISEIKHMNKHINTVVKLKQSWDTFASLPIDNSIPKRTKSSITGPLSPDYNPILCSNEIIQKLSQPTLSKQDFEWCKWAINPKGGKVIVGKSWGLLNTKKDQNKFDNLNCNAVQNNKNPSCDDSWGDNHIKNWINNKINKYQCDYNKKSNIYCYNNDNNDQFCRIENAQINFSKMHRIERGSGQTASKKFDFNFLSSNCINSSSSSTTVGFPFQHLYSNQISTKQCDYIYNNTLILYSHDDIRNLGHTLNDIMNVWIMLWLAGTARDASTIDMLNIDSFKLGHNFNDQPNSFFLPYIKTLQSILKGADFGTDTVCIKNLLIQPLPPRFFIWESWWTDLPCSFIGPSSLYQRWNLHIRNNYNLLLPYNNIKLNKKLQILLVVRNEHTNLWGTSRTSRNFLNLDNIIATLKNTIYNINIKDKKYPEISLIVQDLSKLDLMDQIRLIGESSVMVGMHGAGMASSMHMSIGAKYCCGMLEVGCV